MRGHAGYSKSEAQFVFGHPSATFWSCTRLEIKAQFGPGYLDAIQYLFFTTTYYIYSNVKLVGLNSEENR